MIPRETSKLCFPYSPDISLLFVLGNIRTLGKTKLNVSLGTIHQVYNVVEVAAIVVLCVTALKAIRGTKLESGCCTRLLL